MVMHFRKPLFAHVLKRSRGCDTKADKEDIGLGVGQGAETIVVFLTGGVEESESVRFVADPGNNGAGSADART